ncbi:hypothetical protein JCM3775_000985 [Rhodotorula graminis]|uniref:START domain-containing protein n=1 Tax=Rhodotorula graminis (strain WP1) TaxID=578459 RepID=A0A194SD44_RHOGW|nr:uncharacterized protein RHOBADRAFT_50966 [Rhodotorula graminis WP1]KPV78507.1 hypothetical protein RHOBADRAFT_50966 [Rhodotorula graminis WP1]
MLATQRVEEPALPAVPSYPCPSPWTAEVDQIRQRFLYELDHPEDGWVDLGERDGVQLWKKWHDNDENPVPWVRGETFVDDVTPDAFLAGVVQIPGMRKLWDPRTEAGFMLQRFNRTEVLFYAVAKGKRFIASPRDIVGVQRDFVEEDGSALILQTSVETDRVPKQSGLKRATLNLSGWHFRPEGSGIRITYILSISLGGMIPSAVVSMATTESPMCTGRARDAYYKYGHAPYVHHDPKHEPTTIFQNEALDTDKRVYRCGVTTGSCVGEVFEIRYDTKRMHQGGVEAAVEGAGLELSDDGKGTVRVQVTAAGENATVVLSPR